MVITAQLTRNQVIRIALQRHFQRPAFYLNALAFAGFTAWAILQGPLYLMFVGWLPMLMYALVGVFGAFRAGSGDQPHLQPTRYTRDGQVNQLSLNHRRPAPPTTDPLYLYAAWR